ncbi:hypothetical protein T310_1983 [Rasamsonia emersonii CBS 393.64]|uniref:Rhodopsin domain-containing protein n=1 Tax=Rasamsonia emersonii (strain ATCC 16479 / CBS 393.64 / IMI 116815) TaxID=1408163 RepID=A0A0F4Z1M6_RASE3|nr:hypothetical protein T310_1983 [Rasamsonia emersonii CBS 393.64]KKA24001.1 hypothetical protein T310_1983 [Rasamsonia emersonii CBS 393.64]
MPFVVITGLSCLLRFYSRLYISKSFGMDDWFMVAASIAWLVTQGILGQMIVDGGGKLYGVPQENIAKITLLLFIIEFVYILCQWLIKMSFLTFYLRVLSSTPLYRTMVFAVMAFTTCQTVAVWLFYGLQCIPLGAFFNPSAYPNAKCIPTPITLYIPASLNVLTDLLIYILPIYPLWVLHTTVRRRIGLMFCFTLGGSTIVVSLLRFIVLVQLGSGSRTTYVYGSVDIVTTMELCTAILTANAPSLRSVWKTHISDTAETSGKGKPSRYELGTVSQVRTGRKPGKGSVILGSQGGDHGSEEELCKNGDIMVSTQFNVTTSDNQPASQAIPSSYYHFSSQHAD